MLHLGVCFLHELTGPTVVYSYFHSIVDGTILRQNPDGGKLVREGIAPTPKIWSVVLMTG